VNVDIKMSTCGMNAAFLCQGSDTSTERDKATSAETLRLCGVKVAELWERPTWFV
jgi:hypothetical protein